MARRSSKTLNFELMESEEYEGEGEEPPDLREVLRAGAKISSWLTMGAALPALKTCREIRAFLSAAMVVRITFDFPQASPEPPARRPGPGEPPILTQLERLRAQCRARALHCPADAPQIHLGFALRDAPIKRKAINRKLWRLAPTVKWEDVTNVRLFCRGDLAMVDSGLYRCVEAVLESESGAFLEDHALFKNVVRLSVTFGQLVTLAADACWPQIRRLKVTCRDYDFTDAELSVINRAFPEVTRLHLAVLPSALVTLCGPGFNAPGDLRISLLQENVDRAERLALESDFFVASHLLNLPFRWKGELFSKVVRLQMNELCEKHEGLALNQMGDLLQAMPHLRRLGTLSPQAAGSFLVWENCQLEELVIVMETDQVQDLFRVFLPLDKLQKRSKLQRLAVHMHAPDGCSKVSEKTEGGMCGGWHCIATTLLRATGFVCFSAATKQILETAPYQLPWFDPQRFCLDKVLYNHGRVPSSTPSEHALPYHASELVDRPGGTLVTGPLRPHSEALSPPGSPHHSPSAGGARRSRVSMTSKRTVEQMFAWTGMALGDAIEAVKNME